MQWFIDFGNSGFESVVEIFSEIMPACLYWVVLGTGFFLALSLVVSLIGFIVDFIKSKKR